MILTSSMSILVVLFLNIFLLNIEYDINVTEYTSEAFFAFYIYLIILRGVFPYLHTLVTPILVTRPACITLLLNNPA